MSFWTTGNLRLVTGGSWIRKPANAGTDLPGGISTDSRTLKPGQVFLALRGERFDGHAFLAAAAAGGAPLLIVDDAKRVPGDLLKAGAGPAVLSVTDTLRALAQLAAAYRRGLEGVRVIAVCGSNGKTTTTRLIQALLATRLRGTSSIKSYNNEIGVPLTILGARPGDQYLVCEVGTNAPGEIARLARMVQPDIAVITSIGRAHIEFFGSVERVAREDAAIFADLRPGGAAIVPAGEPHLAEHLKPVPHVVTFGRDEAADLRLTAVEHTPLSTGALGLRFVVNGRTSFELPLIGEHNALNALAAIGVARRLGLDDQAIARGLASATPAEMRMIRRSVGGVELFIDCYNANPESMIAAVRTFADLTREGRRRVLVLGDMLELGEHAPECHREVAEVVREACPADLVVTVGPMSLLIAESLSRSWPAKRFSIHSEMDDAQAERIAAKLAPGDCVLLKGSRGMKLERIAAALERRAEGGSGGGPRTQAGAGAERVSPAA